MTAAYADELTRWEYPHPYDRYSMLDADPSEFLDPTSHFLALVDAAGELAGFRSFGRDGQVPGGTYDDSALDMGGGLRPDLTGRGLGGAAIQLGIDYAWENFDIQKLRVTVWQENKRALKVLSALGFQSLDRFVATTTQEEYQILTLARR